MKKSEGEKNVGVTQIKKRININSLLPHSGTQWSVGGDGRRETSFAGARPRSRSPSTTILHLPTLFHMFRFVATCCSHLDTHDHTSSIFTRDSDTKTTANSLSPLPLRCKFRGCCVFSLILTNGFLISIRSCLMGSVAGKSHLTMDSAALPSLRCGFDPSEGLK